MAATTAVCLQLEEMFLLGQDSSLHGYVPSLTQVVKL